jgi:cell division protein FtsI/penicillin-binding protein 2
MLRFINRIIKKTKIIHIILALLLLFAISLIGFQGYSNYSYYLEGMENTNNVQEGENTPTGTVVSSNETTNVGTVATNNDNTPIVSTTDDTNNKDNHIENVKEFNTRDCDYDKCSESCPNKNISCLKSNEACANCRYNVSDVEKDTATNPVNLTINFDVNKNADLSPYELVQPSATNQNTVALGRSETPGAFVTVDAPQNKLPQ